MNMELSVTGSAAAERGFDRTNQAMDRAVKRVVKDFSLYTRDLTRFFSPVNTGFMQRHVRSEVSPDGYSFETGWVADDFFNAGRTFYPFFNEFGTSKMPARPALGRALQIAAPEFKQAITQAIMETAR